MKTEDGKEEETEKTIKIRRMVSNTSNLDESATSPTFVSFFYINNDYG